MVDVVVVGVDVYVTKRFEEPANTRSQLDLCVGYRVICFGFLFGHTHIRPTH